MHFKKMVRFFLAHPVYIGDIYQGNPGSDGMIVSESNCRDRPLLPSNVQLYLEPAQRSSVLSGFSFRRFADIQ